MKKGMILLWTIGALALSPMTAHAAKTDDVIRLVNMQRDSAGLPALIYDAEIANAAEIRAEEQKDLYSHSRPDGSKWSTVFDQNGIAASYRGENVGMGSVCTAEQIVDAWMNSPAHKKNIMSDKFGRIGVGYYEADGKGYWAQLFAN